MKKAIGVDIGGTKIATSLVTETGEIQFENVQPTPKEREAIYEQVVTGIRTVLNQAELSEKEVSIGLGVPGIIDQEHGMAVFQANLDWEQFPIIERLKHTFPQVERIVFDNDVVQAAFAEWQALQLKHNESMVFFTISTGVASPVLIGGNAMRGLGVAGEIGLLPVRTKNRTELERLEAAVSGPAIERRAQEAYQDESMTTKDVFERFKQQDSIAEEIIHDVVDSLTHGVYALVSILNPNKIVFGGSVMMKNPFLLDLLKEALAKEIIPVQKQSIDSLVLSTYDNNAGLVGAGLRALYE